MTKRLLLAVAAPVAAAVFAPAAAAEAPWCAVVSTGPGDIYWDCHYQTLEQCVPMVLAGNRSYCEPNPAYSGPVFVPKRKIHHRRRARH